MEELYINGKEVDLGGGSITLLYRSNILSDISKITGNNSYTITLPRTTNNEMIFGHSGIPGVEADVVRKYMSAQYVSDGIMIIPDGKAIVLAVNKEAYEVALVWGVGTGITSLSEKNPSLRELEDLNYFVAWTSVSTLTPHINLTAYDSTTWFVFGGAQYGIPMDDSATRSAFYHPAVRCSWILDKIAQEHGVKFDMPTKVRDEIKNLFIPLVTRYDSELRAKNTYLTRNVMASINNSNGVPVNCLNFSGGSTTGYGDATNRYYYVPRITSTMVADIDVTLGVSIINGFTPYLYFATGDGSFSQIGETIESVSKTYDSETKMYMYHFKGSVEIAGVEAGSKVYLCVSPQATGTSKAGKVDIWHKVETIPYPWGFYPIVPNLPDMTQMDFIKAISVMCGVSVMCLPSDPNTIRLVTAEEIYNNRQSAVDWSIYVSEVIPDNMAFTLSGYAQKNWIRYNTDSTVAKNYDWYLPVSNEAIDREKELAKLPFAPSDGDLIPLYSYNKDGGVEFKPCNTRILKGYKRGDEKLGFTFNGLHIKDIINRNYHYYSAITEKPKVLKVKARLTPLILRNLDYRIPVYLEQFGKYYAIISISRTSGDSESEVELLQL